MQKFELARVVERQSQRWFLAGCLIGAIGFQFLPQPAIAAIKQVSQTISSDNAQTFNELVQQAQAQARSLIDQAFADPAITSISVKIMGERNGQEAPLLFASVSRADWQRDPRLDRWTRYFAGSSVVLLGYLQPKGSATSVPNGPLPSPRGNTGPSVSPVPRSLPPAVAPTPSRRNEDDPGFRDD